MAELGLLAKLGVLYTSVCCVTTDNKLTMFPTFPMPSLRLVWLIVSYHMVRCEDFHELPYEVVTDRVIITAKKYSNSGCVPKVYSYSYVLLSSGQCYYNHCKKGIALFLCYVSCTWANNYAPTFMYSTQSQLFLPCDLRHSPKWL